METSKPTGSPQHALYQHTLLSNEKRQAIFDESLRLLHAMGVHVEDEQSTEILKKAGAKHDGHCVRISPGMVQDSVQAAPKQVTMYASNGDTLHLAGSNKYFGSLLADPIVADYHHGPRPPRLADVERNSIIADALPLVHFILKLDWQFSDAPNFELSRLKSLQALMSRRGKLYWCFPLDANALNVWLDMCEICNDGKSLSEYPNVILAVHIDHPMRFKRTEGELLRAIVGKGLPVNLMTQFFAGSTAPYSLAGTMVMMTACNLVELVLAQSCRPGARCLWGGTGAAYNFEKGDASYGGFERYLLSVGLSEMGEFLGLPITSGSGFTTEVTRYDVQCGIESALNNAAAVFGPAHMALGMGSLSEGYGMGSEKIIIDHDVIGGLMRIREGIDTSTEKLAFESIGRVCRRENPSFIDDLLSAKLKGGDEHYYGTVFDRYAMWRMMDWRTLKTPALFDWRKLDNKTMHERAHERIEDILAKHQSTVPSQRIEALERYVCEKEKALPS